jgi:hypothetical protein
VEPRAKSGKENVVLVVNGAHSRKRFLFPRAKNRQAEKNKKFFRSFHLGNLLPKYNSEAMNSTQFLEMGSPPEVSFSSPENQE